MLKFPLTLNVHRVDTAVGKPLSKLFEPTYATKAEITQAGLEMSDSDETYFELWHAVQPKPMK